MHNINSSVTDRLSRGFGLSLLVVTFSMFTGLVAPSASAEVSAPMSAQDQASTRTQIVSVTRWQLINRRPYKVSCTSGGTVYQSVPQPSASPPYNYLGRSGSNANCNIYNGYNGQAWCGHFARFMWESGGTLNVPQVPRYYASSQAWMNEAGSRWRAYGSTLPQPGDVLVWTNNGDSSQGHVAVVTFVDTSKRAITYIGGNEATHGNSDSIVQHSDYWSNMGSSMTGKRFRGFASRF